MKRPPRKSFTWKSITESRLFLPLLALSLILLFDFIFIPGFFSIENREGNLYGSLIDILRNGSTVMLLAIGMTLVIATKGIDLSVGAVMAICSAVAVVLIAWARSSGKLPAFFDNIIDQVAGSAT